MKISTVRSLLLLFDIVLVGGIVGVVYLGMQEGKARNADRRAYQQDTMKALAGVTIEAVKSGPRRSYGSIDRLNYSGKVPKKPEPKDPNAGKKPVDRRVWRPLEDLLLLVGAELHGENVDTPSFILYSRLLDQPLAASKPAPAAASRGSRPTGRRDPRSSPRGRSGARSPRTVQTPRTNRITYTAILGEAIEFSDHELAVVKSIEPVQDKLLGQVIGWKVVFAYDKKDVALEVVGDTPAKGAAKLDPGEAGPISPDKGTWLSWDPSNPHEIQVTDMGMRAFQRDGEKTLEGVRWSSEKIPGKNQKAIKVTHVPPGSALEKGGVRPGDVFESVNGTPVSSRADIVRYAKAHPNMPAYTVVFWRDGARRTRTVRPPSPAGR